MTRIARSLPLLFLLALWCGTGCTAVGYSVGSGVSEDGGVRSGSTRDGLGSTEALQSPPTVPAPDTTTGIRDSSVIASPATDAANPKRGVDSTLVVIAVLAVVAGLIFLVAR